MATATTNIAGAVRVTVVAGYEEITDGHDLPDGLKQAITSQVRAWWSPHTVSEQRDTLEPDRLVIDNLLFAVQAVRRPANGIAE